MKKKEFANHLKKNGCKLKREGANHEIWENETKDKWTTVPRHAEVKRFLCIKICKDLGVPNPFENKNK